MSEPTVIEIKDRYKAYEEHYAQLHRDQEEIDTFYELVFDAGVPEKYVVRMPDTARNWVDVGVRHFTLDNPKSKVHQRNNSETARNQVAVLETTYNFWLRKDIQTIKRAAKKLLKRGEIFLKVNMDDTYFGSEDEDRLFHFPLYLSCPDPINVYCSPAHRGIVPVDVFEVFNITVAEAEEMCERNGWKWKTDKSANKLVKWLSYTSDKLRYFEIDDVPVLKDEIQPNIFKFCPYAHIDAGEGDESYEGKPEYLYRSLLWGKKDMLRMEVRNLSQMDAILSRWAWTRLKAKGRNVAEAIKRIYPGGKIPTDPDAILFEEPDELEFSYLEGSQPPPGLFSLQAMVQSYAHPQAVLSGIRLPGVYSGQLQEDLMASAKPIYKSAFKNLEDALGVNMGMGARILEQVYKSDLEIKNFADDSERKYMRIKPSDIAGHYDCEVQLLAEPPEATDIRKALGKSLRQGGSISHATELREYHDKSQKEVEDEIAQMAAELAMSEPVIREVIAKNAMSRLGMERELEALEEVEQAERGRMVRSIPPIQAGEGVNMGMVRQRGRTTPGFESIPTPQEQALGRVA